MNTVSSFWEGVEVLTAAKIFVVLVGGYLAARIMNRLVVRTARRYTEAHNAALLGKAAKYLLLTLMVLSALSTAGIQLGGLLAAAGLFTVALGFAAQTSVSNIISGLFLLMERPFEVGDMIEAGGTTGVVLSFDLLSTKLRTFDNHFIRIPNETLLKSTVRTMSKYEIRRIDIPFSIAYKEKISKAKEVVKKFLASSSLVLEDPAPMVLTKGLGASGVEMEAKFWIDRSKIFSAVDEVTAGIKKALDDSGIEIPFPHLTVYLGDPRQLGVGVSGRATREKAGSRQKISALDRCSRNVRPIRRSSANISDKGDNTG